MTLGNINLDICPSRPQSLSSRERAPVTTVLIAHKNIVRLLAQLVVAWMLVTVTGFAQTSDPNSTFSDLSTEYDGGVANPTDGSTGNVLQQTLFAAYFWSVAHGNARATVVVSSEYPIVGSRILVPGNIDLVCSSYSPQTYTGGCRIYQADPGSNTASGGSPLLMADYTIGVLPDHKTWCSSQDTPAQPGCTIINSAGASIRGFTLYGGGTAAGGADVGIRIVANNVHVQDTAITGFFGGPGIQNIGGLNNSYDWNAGTNVDTWWCANPSQLTPENLQAALQKTDGNLGGMDLTMVDGEASHNQYSTGCAFPKSFSVSLEYPHLAAMNVSGGGNLIQGNLLQIDGIGLLITGINHRVVDNRVEYDGREAIRSNAGASLFANNRITSACLDPNLINLRPGALDNGVPLYPTTPTYLRTGHIVMDTSGNIEQVISNAGTSDAAVPDWSVQAGGTVDSGELKWENIGPWKAGSTDTTDAGSVPDLVGGLCYAVFDTGGGNTWSANQVGQEVGVNGWSYMRGSYFITGVPGSIAGNTCDGDLPDAYGNGQCWWGGDLFANGGPAYLAPNGQRVAVSGGGTAWVGDYSVLLLADNTSRHYNDFQGMSDGQLFSVTSTTVANVIDPWSLDASGAAVYGHPSLKTCTGGPVVVAPGTFVEFYYDSKSSFGVTQVNCSSGSGAGTSGGLAAVLPGSLTFASQVDGTTSLAQAVTVTNSSTSGGALSIALDVSGDFAQTNTCTGGIAAGATCTIYVAFTPTAAGVRSGALEITDNTGRSLQTVTLSGMGDEKSSSLSAVALSSSVSSLEISSLGQVAITDIHITPLNGFIGTVTLKCDVTSKNGVPPEGSPACTLAAGQVEISNSQGSISTLSISTQAPGVAVAHSGLLHSGAVSLAGLSFLGLLPFGRRRRTMYCAVLTILLAIGMIGCGYTPNSADSGYQVLITATTGTRTATINIPLNVH